MHRALRLFVAVSGASTLASCTIETSTLPDAHAVLEVRGILTVGAATQHIILTRAFSATGSTGQGGATAVSGATVIVTSPAGQVFVGREVLDTVLDPATELPRVGLDSARGYEFATVGAGALIPGGVYLLRVTTDEGDTVTGSTHIPLAGTPADLATTIFNRDQDTLALSWSATPGAISYAVQAEGPTGSFTEFVSATDIRLAGALKSLSLGVTPTLIFAPGFSVPIAVAAVDQNYLDYFRAANDPFAGLGRAEGLIGAYGVFGSVAPLIQDSVMVTADLGDPVIDGHWRLVDGSSALVTARATDFWLYPDENHLPVDSVTTLFAGSYVRPGSAGRLIATGTRIGAAIVMKMTRSPYLENAIHATVGGDTLNATYDTDGSNAIFVRQPGG